MSAVQRSTVAHAKADAERDLRPVDHPSERSPRPFANGMASTRLACVPRNKRPPRAEAAHRFPRGSALRRTSLGCPQAK